MAPQRRGAPKAPEGSGAAERRRQSGYQIAPGARERWCGRGLAQGRGLTGAWCGVAVVLARSEKGGSGAGRAFPGKALQCGCGLAARGLVCGWANRAPRGAWSSGGRSLQNPSRTAQEGVGRGWAGLGGAAGRETFLDLLPPQCVPRALYRRLCAETTHGDWDSEVPIVWSPCALLRAEHVMVLRWGTR